MKIKTMFLIANLAIAFVFVFLASAYPPTKAQETNVFKIAVIQAADSAVKSERSAFNEIVTAMMPDGANQQRIDVEPNLFASEKQMELLSPAIRLNPQNANYSPPDSFYRGFNNFAREQI
jgi:hypothetical protein